MSLSTVLALWALPLVLLALCGALFLFTNRRHLIVLVHAGYIAYVRLTVAAALVTVAWFEVTG